MTAAAPHTAPGAGLERVEAALRALGCGPTRTAGLWKCPVPGHGKGRGDRNPSLRAWQHDGRAFVECRAGCSDDDVRLALGLAWRDFYDDPEAARSATGRRTARRPSPASAPRPTPPDHPPEVETIGPPSAAQIEAMLRGRRIAHAETLARVGAQHIRARFWNRERGSWGRWAEYLGLPALGATWWLFGIAGAGREWRNDDGKLVKLSAGPCSLVFSPDLAQRNGAQIERLYDVEGAGDLLAMADAGMTCVVASTGGATALAGHDAHRARLLALEPAEVVVVRDLDRAGREGAHKAAEWWLHAGVPVRVLELPAELGEGGDVRDYLLGRRDREPMGGAADLDALADAAARREPDGELTPDHDARDAAPSAPSLASVSYSGSRLLALLDRPRPAPVEAGRPVPGHLWLLIAPTMTGKTTLALWSAMARAAGVEPWAGAEPRPAGRVLVYSLDEAPEQVARRMHGLATLHPAGPLARYADRLVVVGPDRDVDPAALDALRLDDAGLATLDRWLREAAASGDPYAEVYIDAYADVLPAGESESGNEIATRIGGGLERLAVTHGCAVTLLHHAGKPRPDAGEEPDVRYLGRGASALAAKARVVSSLEAVAGMPHLRRLRTLSNLGPAPRSQLYEVCSLESPTDELLYWRAAAEVLDREPAEVLAPGERISTRDLARRLAGDALAEGAAPPGDMLRRATALRERWREAGRVRVTDGPRGARMIELATADGDTMETSR